MANEKRYYSDRFIIDGGTASQFLKADGSVDGNTYLTTSGGGSTYLPLSGGTLTGTDSVLLTLNPTANNYGGIQFNYGGALKGFSIYNAGNMYFGGEAGIGTRLQSNGANALTIDTSLNSTFAGNVTTANLFLGSSSVRISPSSNGEIGLNYNTCLLYTSPSPRD